MVFNYTVAINDYKSLVAAPLFKLGHWLSYSQLLTCYVTTYSLEVATCYYTTCDGRRVVMCSLVMLCRSVTCTSPLLCAVYHADRCGTVLLCWWCM